MKIFPIKRLIALSLVIVSIMSVSAIALADSVVLSPGQTDKMLYNISSAPSYYVYLASGTPTGYRVTVQLNLNDLYDLDSNGNPEWKKSDSETLTMGTRNAAILTPNASLFNFVSGRSNKAQLKIMASSQNSGNIQVFFPDL